MRTTWWLSSWRMTVAVVTKTGYIVAAPPIVATFIGQPLDNLTTWLSRQGGLRVRRLK